MTSNIPRIATENLLKELEIYPLWVPKMPLSNASNPADEPVAPLKIATQGIDSLSATPANALSWDELLNSIKQCQACQLCETRKQTVPGVGDPHGSWLVIGEAPGADEDRLGEPFVGQAGKLLDQMLAAIGLRRGRDVYIANILKCRPPDNRNPDPHEIAQCRPFLEQQINLIQPKIILALGRVAALTLLNTEATISSLRGKVLRYGEIPLIVTYHPAYLLRNLADKAKTWEDLCLAKSTLQKST